jgi:hypothetical protein
MRKKLNWNIKLPVYGSGSQQAMKEYTDRVDTEFVKTFEDDGKFFYCLCSSDISSNILYNPYDLQIVSKRDIDASDVYFIVTASSVTRVSFFSLYFACFIKKTKLTN